MNNKMNPEIKTLWLAALRSGEYVQGFGQLKSEPDAENDTTCFCCLGVLTDLYLKETGKKWDTEICTGDEIVPHDSALSEPVAEWAGLSHRDPEITVNGQSDCVSFYNDFQELSFAQLSNLIEEQL